MTITKILATNVICDACNKAPCEYSIYPRPGSDATRLCRVCMLLLSEGIYNVLILQKDSYDTTQVAGR